MRDITFSCRCFSHGHRRKAGRELQTELDTMINGGMMMMDPLQKISQSRSPGRESTQRLCTCFSLIGFNL